MRKVLVLGSAGFLMSNMMRYMLYRTKDFEFVSLDSLASVSDHCRVYTHRKHSFHIGDAGDPELLERIMWVRHIPLDTRRAWRTKGALSYRRSRSGTVARQPPRDPW